MGACNIDMDLDGKLSRSDIEAKFRSAQQDDRHENGHDGYTGGWSTISSLSFPGKTFATYNEAYDYVSKECPKWEGMVVRYKDCPEDKLRTPARDKLNAKVTAAVKALSDFENKEEQKLLKGKAAFIKCSSCNSKLAREKMRRVSCPVCNETLLSKSVQARVAKLEEKIQAAKNKVLELDKKLTEKHGVERWLVYGLASC